MLNITAGLKAAGVPTEGIDEYILLKTAWLTGRGKMKTKKDRPRRNRRRLTVREKREVYRDYLFHKQRVYDKGHFPDPEDEHTFAGQHVRTKSPTRKRAYWDDLWLKAESDE